MTAWKVRTPARARLFRRLRLLQFVAVLSFEAVTGGEFRAAFIIFPHFMVLRFTRLAAQRTLLENIAFRVAIQLEESRFLASIPAVGENNQYLSLHNFTNHKAGFGTGGTSSILLQSTDQG